KIIGGSGGFYESWARLIGRHMGKHIPGNPNIIVQNMLGAGSLIAANYVYNVAKPDGLTVGMFLNTIYLDQLVGRKEVQFDIEKFGWIGSPVSEAMMLYMRADTPYKTIADIIKAKEPPKCGATGTASSSYILAMMLEDTVGAKFNSVLGYQGSGDTDMAVEKGEVVCRAHNVSAHFGREPFNSWHKKNFDRHIVQSGRKRDPNLPDTPTMYELMDQYKTPEMSRRAAQVVFAGGEFGRPMLATPGVAPARLNVLRQAYAKALKDPELLAESKKAKMYVDLSTPDELQTLLREVMNQPREVIERVKKLLGN
ncbi:MAG: Bug family tripartite tricarboxylate transporter substrate binding protein, partial [Candidatus Binatia bacterium]